MFCSRSNTASIRGILSWLPRSWTFVWSKEVRELAERFKTEELPQILSQCRKELLRVLVARHGERHKRFNDTVYQLEPDIKEAPGGLRDFHTARWIGRLLFEHESMTQFAEHGLIAEGELGQILDAQDFLLALRNDLHFLTGRNRNVLSHEHQAEIAAALEYPGDTSQAVEALMKDYFLRAKRIQGFCESMIRYAFPPARRIGRSFKSTRGRRLSSIAVRWHFLMKRPSRRHPANMLKLFYRSAKYQIPISEKALNQVKQHLGLDRRRRSRVCRSTGSVPQATAPAKRGLRCLVSACMTSVC